MLFLRLVKGNLEMWQWIMLAAILIPMTIKDFRTRKINGYICLITILAALSIRLCIVGKSNIELLMDLIPGLILYLISFLTREAIGRGDAIVLLFVGSVIGFNLEIQALSISLILSGIMALILFAMKKVNRKTEIPFLPFLSIGVLAGGII